MIDNHSTYRVLDANYNRAAEGLRTLEEVARFVLNDSSLTDRIKNLRHDLQLALAGLDRSRLLAARDTSGDVGTSLNTPTELQRKDYPEIVAAASHRVQQALRSLEEFSKLIDRSMAASIERIRYASYDVLGQLELRTRSSPFPDDARLYLLIDCQKPLDEFQAILRGLSLAGVDMVQVRDKSMDDRRFIEYARAARIAIQSTSTRLIVNDRVDIAMLVEADGVHVGQEDLPIDQVRRLVGRSMWIGVSTHDIEQAREAVRSGADYIGCGPTFPSATKSFESFAGLAFLRQVASEIHLPIFAIGGIELDVLPQVTEAGVGRIAVSGAILKSDSPAKMAQSMAKALRETAM